MIKNTLTLLFLININQERLSKPHIDLSAFLITYANAEPIQLATTNRLSKVTTGRNCSSVMVNPRRKVPVLVNPPSCNDFTRTK